MSSPRRSTTAPTEEHTTTPPTLQASKPRRRRPTRISSLHVGLIVSALALVLLVVFLVQNAHSVDISFLGGHLRVSLAVAMLISAVAGALIVGAAGAARIAQLRRSARRAAATDDHRRDGERSSSKLN